MSQDLPPEFTQGVSAPVAQNQHAGQDFDLAQITEVVRRRWKIATLLLLLGCVAGFVHFYITPKAYRSSTTVQIERSVPMPASSDTAWALYLWNSEYYPTQTRLLQSRGLAERVVRDMKLWEDPLFNPGGTGSAARSGGEPSEALVVKLAQKLLKGLSIQPIKETQLMEIVYDSSSPELAARIANGFVESFIRWRVETGQRTVSKASDLLADQIDALKQDLRDKEAKLQDYSRRSDILVTGPSTSLEQQRFEALNRDYINAVSERIDKESKYRELQNATPTSLAEKFQTDPSIVQLKQDQAALEREYATKLNTYKPEWPGMVDLKQKIDRGRLHLTDALKDLIVQERKDAQTDYEAAVRREQRLKQEIENTKEAVLSLNSKALEYTNLKVEVETRRQLLDSLLKRQSETEMAGRLQSSGESNVRVVDRALVPGAPYYPSLRKDLMGGGVLGLILAAGLVFLLEFSDRTVKTGEQTEKLLNLPVLTVIPDTSGRKRGYGYGYGGYGYAYGATKKKRSVSPVRWLERKDETPPTIELLPHEKPRHVISEAYRSLRTALLLSSAEQLKTVAITSAQSGEGKTSTAVNLAVVLAQLGRQVLLIDADLRKPRLHRIFLLSNRVGLVGYLAAGEGLKSAILPAKVPGLHVVPSGPIPPNPSELLASARMHELIAAARNGFDYVVIDCPPVLPVSDAVVVGAQVDGVVLCLQARQVTRDAARSCADRLRLGEVHLLGAVLNRYRAVGGSEAGRYYYYYQSYGETESSTSSSSDSAA